MQNFRFRDSRVWRSILRIGESSKTEMGSALVEFALTGSVLIVLVSGAAEFGWVTYAAIEVANAARAAVSYGCQTSATAADTVGIQNTAIKDAQDITLGTPTVTSSCICSNGNAASGGCGSPTACPGSEIETILTVQTQATVTPTVRIPGLPPSFTLHGQAVQKVLQ
jgi:Flp pilus assembly protein TadG